MGSAAHGPLLLVTPGGARASGAVFLNTFTLNPLPLRGALGRIDFGDGQNLRASADGKVFTVWRPDRSPNGIQTVVLTGSDLVGHYEHKSAGHLSPSTDGRVIYTGQGRYTNQAKAIADAGMRANYCLPSQQPAFYLSVQHPDRFGPPGKRKGTLVVHLEGDLREVARLPEVEVPADLGGGGERSALAPDKRVHFIPDAKLIVVVPSTNDQLVLHRFDVMRALERSGQDYLFVASQPATAVKRGNMYSYQLEVKSKKGGVRCKLDSGPPSMTVTPAGLLTWQVPPTYTRVENEVILTISDASGQERFHTFTLTVRR
jgi:hypothetical protein